MVGVYQINVEVLVLPDEENEEERQGTGVR
jgi:hypothetical protein